MVDNLDIMRRGWFVEKFYMSMHFKINSNGGEAIVVRKKIFQTASDIAQSLLGDFGTDMDKLTLYQKIAIFLNNHPPVTNNRKQDISLLYNHLKREGYV